MHKSFASCSCQFDNGCDCYCDEDNTPTFEDNSIDYYTITEIVEDDLDCLSADALFIEACLENELL